MISKRILKQFLGEVPYAAEVYWRFVQRGRPLNKSFSLRKLEKSLPEWRAQAAAAGHRTAAPKKILLFATLRYWIEHTTLLGMALSGLGHQVTLAYLPYPSFRKPFQRFDVRRQNAYARSVLELAAPQVKCISLLDVRPAVGRAISPALFQSLQEVAERDTQYTLQIERVERDRHDSEDGRLFHLRLERNLQAAAALLGYIQSLPPAERPDLLITPNGSILEMGAVYQAARTLDIPVVTYEFGEQRGRIWFAHNGEVMRQETDALWERHANQPLTESQWQQIRNLYAARQNARLWENFARQWQGQPAQGGQQVRQSLGLDERPVVLLAANVIGDSLTLGRQVFTKSMTEWLQRTVELFASRTDAQLLVRIHPGERYLKGPSVAEVVHQALPTLPPHIHLIAASDPVNTYDLVEIADLGLVYTTTVGMEMAMTGVPVIVGGQTHYRSKGFTHDPCNWVEQELMISQALNDPSAARLSREQVESAWNYAYRFFFDYPTPFPWHLLGFWDELETWPVGRALSEEGLEQFGNTFRWLAGDPRQFE
jgi:hypothetical protein